MRGGLAWLLVTVVKGGVVPGKWWRASGDHQLL